MKTLKIYETFSSIQGESTHAGRPCFFIRLSGCNLRCSYCDTSKAWSYNAGKEMTIDELIEKAKASRLDLVEVTGGEPMLQAATPELCERLLKEGFEVLMETNGSQPLQTFPEGVKRIIDWKTPSSGETEKMFADNFQSLRPGDEVKFVIADDRDFENALEVIRKFSIAGKATILFAPVFGSMPPDRLVAKMLEYNVPARLNLQLHKFIWGADAEGV